MSGIMPGPNRICLLRPRLLRTDHDSTTRIPDSEDFWHASTMVRSPYSRHGAPNC